MVKLIALYKTPADPKAFDEKYFNEHLPLANQMPGLRKAEVSKITGAPGGEAGYYMMAEMYFDDIEALNAAMSSPEGKAAAKNIMSFAKEYVSMMFAEVEKMPAQV